LLPRSGNLLYRGLQTRGGSYSPETRRKYFITGPQWAGAFEGHALFHAPTRRPVTFEEVIEQYGRIGIGYWCTHDTDVIPAEQLGKDGQHEIVARIRKALANNGLKCPMVTTETFHNAVFAAGPAAESPEIRKYEAWRVCNTGEIGT
jgi:xylose isomerase